MATEQELEVRRMRGQAIVEHDGQVRRIDENAYKVHSQSGEFEYDILSTESGWVCSCPDFTHREVKCKHIFAVELSIALRSRIENARTIQPLDIQSCLFCYSKNVVKHGVRHNKNGDLQRFSCRDCGKRFTRNLGFEGLKATPQMVTGALQLYFSGESLRNTQNFLRLQGVNISHQTVYNWIQKYVGLMGKYLDQITPNVSDTWRADELYVKVKGDMKYLFAMMDDETRFWIAQEVANAKETHDARRLLHMSQELMGKKPKTLITDGAKNYHEAYMKEYWTQRPATRPTHVRHITISGDHNNNKMERFNGEVRDREKVMRGLKTENSPILKGYQIYHNFVRPHEGLDGATPAEKCGIQIEGENKWLTIIQNASRVPKVDSTKKSEDVPRI